jgi:hypothetical protein
MALAYKQNNEIITLQADAKSRKSNLSLKAKAESPKKKS